MTPAPPPINIALIEAEHEFFAKTGPMPTSFDDVRRFPRFYHRAWAAAQVYPVRADQGPPLECRVATRDLSRAGLSLLHSQQLFPGQRIDITLLDGVPRRLEVQWCRRLVPDCYAAGCRFVQPAAGGERPQS